MFGKYFFKVVKIQLAKEIDKRMRYGTCLLSLIPQRAEPSEKSELVNQLLFGDFFSIIEIRKDWLNVRNVFDGYEGWVDKKMVMEIDDEYYNKIKKETPFVNGSLTKILNNNNKHFQSLTPGSSIYDLTDNKFHINNTSFEIVEQGNKNLDFKSLTHQFLNTPYLWGGKSLFGIDCSGFVQVIYKILGTILPRDASEQSKVGNDVGFIQETNKGDLAFFENEENNITHVGILLDNQTIIHASGYVRIDKIDSHGIFNTDVNDYTHKLRLIKRCSDSLTPQ